MFRVREMKLHYILFLYCSKYLDDAVVCIYCNRTVGLWLLRGRFFDVEKQHHNWCTFASDTSRHTDGWQCRQFVLQYINSSKVNQLLNFQICFMTKSIFWLLLGKLFSKQKIFQDLPVTNWAAKAEVWKSAIMPKNISSLIKE